MFVEIAQKNKQYFSVTFTAFNVYQQIEIVIDSSLSLLQCKLVHESLGLYLYD